MSHRAGSVDRGVRPHAPLHRLRGALSSAERGRLALMFVSILVVGLVWTWGHGDLEWVKGLSAEKTAAANQPAAPAKGRAA